MSLPKEYMENFYDKNGALNGPEELLPEILQDVPLIYNYAAGFLNEIYDNAVKPKADKRFEIGAVVSGRYAEVRIIEGQYYTIIRYTSDESPDRDGDEYFIYVTKESPRKYKDTEDLRSNSMSFCYINSHPKKGLTYYFEHAFPNGQHMKVEHKQYTRFTSIDFWDKTDKPLTENKLQGIFIEHLNTSLSGPKLPLYEALDVDTRNKIVKGDVGDIKLYFWRCFPKGLPFELKMLKDISSMHHNLYEHFVKASRPLSWFM